MKIHFVVEAFKSGYGQEEEETVPQHPAPHWVLQPGEGAMLLLPSPLTPHHC